MYDMIAKTNDPLRGANIAEVFRFVFFSITMPLRNNINMIIKVFQVEKIHVDVHYYTKRFIVEKLYFYTSYLNLLDALINYVF